MPPTDPLSGPATVENRDALVAYVQEAEARGDVLAAGRGLTRLSTLVFHLGSWDGRPAIPLAASLANRAIAHLRPLGAKGELADALRARAIPFVLPDIALECLQESLTLYREAQDRAGEAWALYGMTTHPVGLQNKELLGQTEEIFRETGDARGIAVCLRRQAMWEQGEPARCVELLTEAAREYEKSGDLKEAARTFIMAETFGSDTLSSDERKGLLLESVRLYTSAKNLKELAITYRGLASLAGETGDSEGVVHYTELEDGLDEPLYGGREGRIKADIESLQEILPVMSGPEARRIRREIKELQAKLAKSQSQA